MANKKLSEGVGKKIVEALKKQSEIEVNPFPSEESTNNLLDEEEFLDNLDITENNEMDEVAEMDSFFNDEPLTIEEPQYQPQEQFVTPQQEQSFANYQQPTSNSTESFVNELDTFEIPSNIAALKKLISQLPSGVTRQTGAQIIRQTMEALGISMKGVLQEAQQVQDGLSGSVKECQNTIQEYKKQIISLEKQCQNHQRQYSALNELISLFIQTGNR